MSCRYSKGRPHNHTALNSLSSGSFRTEILSRNILVTFQLKDLNRKIGLKIASQVLFKAFSRNWFQYLIMFRDGKCWRLEGPRELHAVTWALNSLRRAFLSKEIQKKNKELITEEISFSSLLLHFLLRRYNIS